MQWLEHRIPPPVVLLFSLLLMALIGYMDNVRMLAISHMELKALILGGFGLAGVSIAIMAVLDFRRAKTTVNPLRPDTASELVTSGIFRFSRNPMYLGMALLAVGWALYLGSVYSWAGVVVFVLYISRFQIAPEERAMQRVFGNEFARYRRGTRRWF